MFICCFCLVLVALAPSLFCYIDFSISHFFAISISRSTDKSVSKTVPNFSFLSFPPDYSALPSSCSAGLNPALSCYFRRIIRLFLLRILPDWIRLLPIPAPHCPVPASSASGLRSLFPPPCPVRATSAGAFFFVTSGAFLLPKTLQKVYYIFIYNIVFFT